MKLGYKFGYFNKNKKKVLQEINITPFVDIVLVLLIIFMITAPMLNNGFNVDLPKVASKQLTIKKQEQIIFSVDNQNKIRINDKIYHLTSIPNYLANYNPSTTQIFIKGDEISNYGTVIKLMAIINKHGFTNISLVTEPLD